jgi:predicted hydrocarbon binding protein
MDHTRGDRSLMGMEVAGEWVGTVAAGVDRFSADSREPARAVLEDAGLADADPAEWYALAGYVDAVASIHDIVGDQAVHALGQRVARAVAFPEGTEDVPAALDALDEVCRAGHRGGDHGGYAFRQIGDEDGRVECRTPYPCAFDRGIVEGAAVAHAEGFVRVCEVGACRADGAERCTYEVSW